MLPNHEKAAKSTTIFCLSPLLNIVNNSSFRYLSEEEQQKQQNFLLFTKRYFWNRQTIQQIFNAQTVRQIFVYYQPTERKPFVHPLYTIQNIS